MQSATVTVRRIPGVAVAWPSASSRRTSPAAASCQSTVVPWTWRAITAAWNDGRLARRVRQRARTSPTGATWPPSPRSKGGDSSPRPVIPARTPNRVFHSGSSNRGTWPATLVSGIHPLDGRAQRLEPLVDVLVPPVDLPDVLNGALPLRREGGEENGHPGPDVRRFDPPAPEPGRPRDDGAVGIAEHDMGSHPDQLVHEEEARLEHLLEDQQQPLALARRHDGDGHHVRGERGPGTVLELGDVSDR